MHLEIEATLSEAAWQVIEDCTTEAEDIIAALNSGFHAIIRMDSGLIATTCSLEVAERIIGDSNGYALINVDTGKVMFQ